MDLSQQHQIDHQLYDVCIVDSSHHRDWAELSAELDLIQYFF